MRKSMSAPAAIAAVLAAMAANHAAQAAPADCLSAPNGAAPNGQHWYYHLDRAANRKCWYLRDLGAAAAAPAPQADRSAASPPASERPEAATPTNAAMPAPPAATTNARAAADADPPPAAAAPATTAPADVPAVASSQPAAMPGSGTLWSDPQTGLAANPGDTQNNDAAVAAPETPPAADAPARRAPTKKRATPARETQAAGVATSGGIGENLLIIFLAAVLAVAVCAIFAVMRRRRPAVLHAAGSGPRFGSRPERDDGLWLKWPRRDAGAEPDAPIQGSLIPQQVSMTRQSAPRR